MVSEEQLLRRARQGDLDAFNQLVIEHQALVFNLCFRMLGQRQAAEDTAQEAFIAAWRNIGGMRGETLRPWLLRIAANACRDELRRRRRRPTSSLDLALEDGVREPPDEAPLPETSLLTSELRQQIQAALLQLPEDQALAVVLCDIEGLDYAEIAAVMRTSLGTVKSRIARGRARLRVLLVNETELSAPAARPEV